MLTQTSILQIKELISKNNLKKYVIKTENIL